MTAIVPELQRLEQEEASQQALLLLASIVRRLNLRPLAEQLIEERAVLLRLALAGLPEEDPARAEAALDRVESIGDMVAKAIALQEAIVRYEKAVGAL